MLPFPFTIFYSVIVLSSLSEKRIFEQSVSICSTFIFWNVSQFRQNRIQRQSHLFPFCFLTEFVLYMVKYHFTNKWCGDCFPSIYFSQMKIHWQTYRRGAHGQLKQKNGPAFKISFMITKHPKMTKTIYITNQFSANLKFGAISLMSWMFQRLFISWQRCVITQWWFVFE